MHLLNIGQKMNVPQKRDSWWTFRMSELGTADEITQNANLVAGPVPFVQY